MYFLENENIYNIRLALTYHTNLFRYKLELIELIIRTEIKISVKEKTINYLKASIFTPRIENSQVLVFFILKSFIE